MLALLTCVSVVRKVRALLPKIIKQSSKELARRPMPDDALRLPEQVMTEIDLRATHIGPVLEQILMMPHHGS
jgi:hypothetical protein